MMLWLNPSSGISGDMLLGALIDLGAPIGTIESAIAQTGIEGWSLSPRRVLKNGIAAVYAGVETDDTAHERHASELIAMAARATPAPVASLAVRALKAIARVEARIHDSHPDEVHLHEIGGVDTIVDVVGVSAALHALSIDRVSSNSVALGTGSVTSAHGTIPSPAPATLALLQGARAHVIDLASETTTPTGAALLLAMGTRYEPIGPVILGAVGYGAGTKDFAGRPNVLQATLCAESGDLPEGVTRRMVALETNVDDVTGEQLADVITALLRRGAADAWIVPSIGKKGRPAAVIHVLADPELVNVLTALLYEETGTLGVRHIPVQRHELDRWTGDVQVGGEHIRVKYSPVGQKPERDDVVRAAESLGRSVREVAHEAAHRAAAERIRFPRPDADSGDHGPELGHSHEQDHHHDHSH